MLEPILKGLVEWLYEMMVDIMSYASGELLGVMSMDLSYFERTAPIISDIVSVFIALGWALLIGNLVFQSLKAIMSGAGFEAEDPKILFLRTFAFAFLLLASRQICNIGSSITGTVINMLELPGSITVTTPDESMFSLGSGAKWLLVIIVGVVLMVQMVKLLFEIGERYVITSVLTFFAPLAFSMGGSKNTNDIFKGWCRMYGSMLVMMIMNIVFLKLIMSAMSQMAAGGVLVWLVFVVALTRVARKIDSHIGKIGLNPAQTGSGIGSRLPGMMTMVAVRTMGSLVSRSMANAKGGSGGKTGKSGNAGRGGTMGAGGRGSRPNNPNSGGGFGGSSTVNNAGRTNSVNTGTHINTGGANTSVGNSETLGTQMGIPNGNKNSKVNNPQNATNTVRNGGTTVNQNGISKNAGSEPKGTYQRPPVPRSTAGGYPNMSSTVSGVLSGENNRQPAQNETKIKTNVPNASKPIKSNMPNTRTGNSHQSNDILQGGAKVITKTNINAENNNNHSNIHNRSQKGADISGGNNYSASVGGNSGGININGGNAGGGTQKFSEHSGGEHFTDRSSERFRESSTGKYTHLQGHTENIEKRINHEYKHGRYNPAAANKKVKRSYYKKDNPLSYRVHNNPKKKRGENNGYKHK